MKKALIILGVSLLAACGTTETSKQDVGEVKTMTVAEVKEERTIETNGEAPWIRNAAVRLQKLVDDGETVHLWSDAAEFEKWVLTIIDYVPPKSNAVNAPDPKEQRANVFNSTNDHIKVFVGELSKRHPDKQEYFDTLTQAGESLANGDKEAAKIKLTAAQTLRAN
jgi:hypothetical protein